MKIDFQVGIPLTKSSFQFYISEIDKINIQNKQEIKSAISDNGKLGEFGAKYGHRYGMKIPKITFDTQCGFFQINIGFLFYNSSIGIVPWKKN